MNALSENFHKMSLPRTQAERREPMLAQAAPLDDTVETLREDDEEEELNFGTNSNYQLGNQYEPEEECTLYEAHSDDEQHTKLVSSHVILIKHLNEFVFIFNLYIFIFIISKIIKNDFYPPIEYPVKSCK